MKRLKIFQIVGARPNFIKLASLHNAFKKHSKIQPILVHTGQHFDDNMSKIFFDELGIPAPDINLEVASGSHGTQTGEIMKRLEPLMIEKKPDLVVVVGDVNSTMAGALVASKLGIPVAHVEAGLRSFDRRMPEEINRMVTDVLSDYLFVTEKSGLKNLKKEGVSRKRIYFVGNVMIDTLLTHKEHAEKSDILRKFGLESSFSSNSKKKVSQEKISDYAVLTLHRPSNVDKPEVFEKMLKVLAKIGNKLPIIFPVHPRTRNQISQTGLEKYFCKINLTEEMGKFPLKTGIYLTEPMGYLDFLKLMSHAKMVLTDSGGIQEETTALGVHCITLRENTERPVTITSGTNILVGYNYNLLLKQCNKILKGKKIAKKKPELWDGKAGERIVKILIDAL